MNNRQHSIVLQLVNADGPLTSAELGRRLGVSSRTIKTDMSLIAEALAANGAELVSRPHCGYNIEVQDKDRFDVLMVSALMQGGAEAVQLGEEQRMIYIARRLVASRKGLRREELAETMYLTQSALRAPLKAAVQFCQSFHLTVTARPRQGLRVEGPEHLLRIAMTELYELHYHKTVLTNADEDYARWIRCDNDEYQDIRHAFLKVLRESGYALRDSMTQRIARYLIIARNRRREGLRIMLPAAWMQEMAACPLYQVAQDIYRTLGENFPGYDMDRAETCFLAIYMVTNMDVSCQRDVQAAAPHLWGDVRRVTAAMLREVRQHTGLDLAAVCPGVERTLDQIALTMVGTWHYGFDGRQFLDYDYERDTLSMPLCASFAHLMAEGASKAIGMRYSITDMMQLGSFMLGQMLLAPLPVRPLRLVATNVLGSEFARISAQGLQARYPDLIESIQPLDLYEVRRLAPGSYDAVLVANCRSDQVTLIGYNYDVPGAVMLLTNQGRDYGRIYNDILIDAYRPEQYLPPADAVHVQRGFLYSTPEQAFQYLCARHARDDASAAAMQEAWQRREEHFSMAYGNCAVAMGEPALCKRPCLELYGLKKPGNWNGHRVHWLLFCCPPAYSLPQMRMFNAMIKGLVSRRENLEAMARDPLPTLRRLLRESLQTV